MRFIQNLLTIQTLTFIHRRFMSITPKEKEDNLEILNNFIGYGNPEAKYWFIGIEEHSPDKNRKGIDWELESKRFDIYKQNYQYKPFSLSNKDFKFLNEKITYTPTYEGIKKIYNQINSSNKIETDEIGNYGINLFIANLYPLGRSTTRDKYNEFVKRYLYDDSFEKWFEDNWEKRKDILKKFLINKLFKDSKKEKYIFCLGISSWNEFEELFKSSLNEPTFKFDTIKNSKNDNYYGYYKANNYNIYCLYHPASSRFNNLNFEYNNDLKIIL